MQPQRNQWIPVNSYKQRRVLSHSCQPSPRPGPHLAQPFPAAGTDQEVCWKPAQGSNNGKALACAWEVPAQPLWWLTWHCHTGQAEGLLSGKLFPVKSLMPRSFLLGPCTAATSPTVAGQLQQSQVRGLSVRNSKMEHTKASCSALPCLPSSQAAEEIQLQKPWESFN